MSFIDKVKQWVGMVGIKVQLQSPLQVAKTSLMIDGIVMITAQSDQHIEEVEIEFSETMLTKNGDNYDTKKYLLGTGVVSLGFDIKKGEVKQLPFRLPFSYKVYDKTRLHIEQTASPVKGLMNMMDQRKFTYDLSASAMLKGTVFPPTDVKKITMTGSIPIEMWAQWNLPIIL